MFNCILLIIVKFTQKVVTFFSFLNFSEVTNFRSPDSGYGYGIESDDDNGEDEKLSSMITMRGKYLDSRTAITRTVIRAEQTLGQKVGE